MLKFLTVIVVLMFTVPAYAVTLTTTPSPEEECRQAIFDDEKIMQELSSPQEDIGEVMMFAHHLLVLCDLSDPLDESWWRLQSVIVDAESTGDAETYLAKLGVSKEVLDSRVEKMRIFRARQAYARFYMRMHWQLLPQNFPAELADLYHAYGALLDESKDPHRGKYSDLFESATEDSLANADKLLGFDNASIGLGLKCAGWEGYIGFGMADIIPICSINSWPSPVYPLVTARE